MSEQVRFPERLRFLRLEKRWTPENFAGMLDSHRSTIVRYEKGDRFPSFETLIRMASLFSVSTDYLLGITDRRGTENSLKARVIEKEIWKPKIPFLFLSWIARAICYL